MLKQTNQNYWFGNGQNNSIHDVELSMQDFYSRLMENNQDDDEDDDRFYN